MCSAITHALVGAAVGMACQTLWPVPPASDDLGEGLLRERERTLRQRVPLFLAVMAALPDADVAMHAFVRYSHPLGHRGAFHSLGFYLLVALACARLAPLGRRLLFGSACFLALASHSLLDMFTNGGYGIALFWPVSSERLFFPWRPIPVSPMSVAGFISLRGLRILAYELPPALLAFGLAYWIRRRYAR